MFTIQSFLFLCNVNTIIIMNKTSLLQNTCVSVSFNVFDNWHRFATDRYLFLSNSASSDLICAAVNAVLGLFFLSSSDLLSEYEESETRQKTRDLVLKNKQNHIFFYDKSDFILNFKSS